MIPTWAERCEKFGNKIVTNAMIQQTMQEEIDELRKELALQRLSDIGQEIECELTDKEITDVFRASSDHIKFARAILAKACNLK